MALGVIPYLVLLLSVSGKGIKMKSLLLVLLISLMCSSSFATRRTVTEKLQELKTALGAEGVSPDRQRSVDVNVSGGNYLTMLKQYNETVHTRTSQLNEVSVNADAVPDEARLVATATSVDVIRKYLVKMNGSFAEQNRASIEKTVGLLQELLDLGNVAVGFDNNGRNGCGHREVLVLVADFSDQVVHAVETEACEL
jgi:hypothetical protein